MLDFRKKIDEILRKYGLNECGDVQNVNEEELDKRECETMEREGDKANESNDTVIPFALYQTYAGHVFCGNGAMECGEIFMPGVLHERMEQEEDLPLVRGVVYEPENPDVTRGSLVRGVTNDKDEPLNEDALEIHLSEDNRFFSGVCRRIDGRIYVPGVLYETGEN